MASNGGSAGGAEAPISMSLMEEMKQELIDAHAELMKERLRAQQLEQKAAELEAENKRLQHLILLMDEQEESLSKSRSYSASPSHSDQEDSEKDKSMERYDEAEESEEDYSDESESDSNNNLKELPPKKRKIVQKRRGAPPNRRKKDEELARILAVEVYKQLGCEAAMGKYLNAKYAQLIDTLYTLPKEINKQFSAHERNRIGSIQRTKTAITMCNYLLEHYEEVPELKMHLEKESNPEKRAQEMRDLLNDPSHFGAAEHLRPLAPAIWLPEEKLPKLVASHWMRLQTYARNLVRFLIAWMEVFRNADLDLHRKISKDAVKKVLSGSPL